MASMSQSKSSLGFPTGFGGKDLSSLSRLQKYKILDSRALWSQTVEGKRATSRETQNWEMMREPDVPVPGPDHPGASPSSAPSSQCISYAISFYLRLCLCKSTVALILSRKRVLSNSLPPRKSAHLQRDWPQTNPNTNQEDEREPDSHTQGSLPPAG